MAIAEATTTIWFSDWTDKRLASRLAVLKLMESPNRGEVTGAPGEMFTTLFPNGYDPENHPDDNLTAVRDEIARREM